MVVARMGMLAALLALVPGPLAAQAEPEAPFGRAGQWLLDGSLALRFSRFEDERSYAVTRSSVSASPGMWWLVVDGLAVGASLLYERSSESWVAPGSVDLEAESAGAALRLGHYHALSSRAGLFPQYALGYVSERQVVHLDDFDPSSAIDRYARLPIDGQLVAVRSALRISAFLPVLWHPARHVFLGAGPVIAFQHYPEDSIEGRDFALSFGLHTVIGGWLE